MGGRGASSTKGNTNSAVKFKSGSFNILTNIGGKDAIKTQKGRLFSYNGYDFALKGNSNEGYSITHIESGMRISGKTYYTLKEFKQNYNEDMKAISNFIKNNKAEINSAINRFNKAKK